MRPLRHPIPSLLTTLTAVPDPRKRRGVRHPLPALLGLACTAALCGYTTPTEIADFGRNHAAELHDALGFTLFCAKTLSPKAQLALQPFSHCLIASGRHAACNAFSHDLLRP